MAEESPEMSIPKPFVTRRHQEQSNGGMIFHKLWLHLKLTFMWTAFAFIHKVSYKAENVGIACKVQ